MDLEIKGQPHRTGRLNARQQFHVTRRLAPVMIARMQGIAAMAAIVGASARPAADAVEPEGQPPLSGDALIAGFMPIANAIKALSDEEADYVITTCLSVCSKLVNGQAAPVQAPNGRLMFDDMDMAGMLKLVQAVVKENCESFFDDPSGLGLG